MELIKQFVENIKSYLPDSFSIVLDEDRDLMHEDHGMWLIKIIIYAEGSKKLLIPLEISEAFAEEASISNDYLIAAATTVKEEVIMYLQASINQMEVLIRECKKTRSPNSG